MKELDKTKKYDLSKLSDGQFLDLLKNVGYGNDIEDINKKCLYYNKEHEEWISSVSDLKTNACATELFEDEKEVIKKPYLTYEEKENILNYKPMTEEEKNNIPINPFYKIIIKKHLDKLINELEIALKFAKKKKYKIEVYEQFIEQLKKM